MFHETLSRVNSISRLQKTALEEEEG